MSGTFESKIVPSPGGGGSGGVSSINGDTSAAQLITGSSPLKVANSGATHVLSGPFPSFVFKPGGTQTAPGGNVYITWASLYTDLSKVSGIKNVFIDDTLGTATIQAGTYNLGGVVFYGILNSSSTAVLNLADGAILSVLFQEVTDSLVIRTLSSLPVFTQSTDQAVVVISVGAGIESNGTAEFFNVPGDNQQLIVFMDTVGVMQNNTYEVINLTGNASQALIFGGQGCITTPNIIRGAATSSMVLLYMSASATMDPTQVNMAGGKVTEIQENAIFVAYNNVDSSGLSATDVETAINQLALRRSAVSSSLSLSAQSSGSTETTLLDVTTETALVNFADQIEIIMEGSFAANVNAKTIKLYIGGTQVYSSGALVVNGGRFRVVCYFYVVAGLGSGIAYTFSTSTNAVLGTQAAKTAVTADFSTDQEIKLTGTGVTNGDIIGELALVRRNFSGI